MTIFHVERTVIDGRRSELGAALPATGQPDNGEILKVDTTRLPVLKSATLTIHVR